MKLSWAIGLSGLVMLMAGEAHATNAACEEHRLALSPIAQVLVERLRWHMWNRDNDLKITAEEDLDAFIKITQLNDKYGKLITNAIRDYNDGDPVADHLCIKYILEFNCESYLVYQDTVINLPGMAREEILAEGKRRCDAAETFGPPPTAAPDKFADKKAAHAATLDRLFFETNRRNLSPISDAEVLISAEQKALEARLNQRISWTGLSGKTSGTIDIVKEMGGIGNNYTTCRCINVSITTEYSKRTGTEGICRKDGNWELDEWWRKVGCG